LRRDAAAEWRAAWRHEGDIAAALLAASRSGAAHEKIVPEPIVAAERRGFASQARCESHDHAESSATGWRELQPLTIP